MLLNLTMLSFLHDLEILSSETCHLGNNILTLNEVLCPQKTQCTTSKNGRIVTLHRNEEMMQSLRYYSETSKGGAEARERVKVEHALASICNRKGPRARYKGTRLNEFDLNRTAMITNLHISMNMAA